MGNHWLPESIRTCLIAITVLAIGNSLGIAVAVLLCLLSLCQVRPLCKSLARAQVLARSWFELSGKQTLRKNREELERTRWNRCYLWLTNYCYWLTTTKSRCRCMAAWWCWWCLLCWC
jgi:hypothetical protein